MPSFEFADCPTRLPLTLAADTQEQAGAIHCTIRNTTAKRQTARLHIEAKDDLKPEWFSFVGAPPTSPREIEQDIAAEGTFTAQVMAKIPPKTPPGARTFRLRATSEASPDVDFTDGPAIAIDIAAWKEPETKRQGLPLWAYGVVALFVLGVIGVIAYLAWPRGLDPSLVRGKPFSEAAAIASNAGYANIKAVRGQAEGHDPARQIVVGVGKDEVGATALLIDPGVPIPANLARRRVVDAVKLLLDVGILPNQNPQFDSRSDMPDGVVTRTIPQAPTAVALGGAVTIVLNRRPDGSGKPCVPLIACLPDLVGPRKNLDRFVLPPSIQRRLDRRPR